MENNVQILHEILKNIYLEGIFRKETNAAGEVEYINSIACDGWDHYTEDEGEDVENCIWENLNQMHHRMKDNWFNGFNPADDIDYYFRMYIIQLYLFVSWINMILKQLSENSFNAEVQHFKDHSMSTLQKINRWANFVKHPKHFMYSHWPTFFFDGEYDDIDPESVLVDQEFVDKHYKSVKSEVPILLQNNSNVMVKMPDLKTMTASFAIEINDFTKFLCGSKDIMKYLQSISNKKIEYADANDETENA